MDIPQIAETAKTSAKGLMGFALNWGLPIMSFFGGLFTYGYWSKKGNIGILKPIANMIYGAFSKYKFDAGYAAMISQGICGAILLGIGAAIHHFGGKYTGESYNFITKAISFYFYGAGAGVMLNAVGVW